MLVRRSLSSSRVLHSIFSLALVWGLVAPVSGATPLLVQKASGRTSSATALNVAAVSPVTAGNLMIVSVSAWPNAPTSVTDTLGSTYTLAGAQRKSSGGAYTAIYYARLNAGGANTVTYRTGGSNGQMAMVIAEFANIASPSPLDAATGAVGSGSVPSSGNLTPTVSGDLMIAAGTHEATLVTSAYPGSTMIAIATENSDTNQPLAMSYQVLTTTTPTPARFNLSASAPWAQAGALFKATASGDVTPPTVPTGLVISGVSSSGFTVSWSASTDNVAVAGYRLDVSTQSTFASFVTGYNNANLGNVVTTPVTGLTGSTTYFARLRAYDAALNTSGNSAVASTTTPTPPDVTSPAVAITSPATGATVSGSVSVLGTASDNVGLSQIEVRVDSGVFNLASGLGNWSYTLNTLGLSDGAHTIAARATDSSGNTSQATRSVTVDNTAPVITGVNASAITASQASIGWQTNELSDSRVEYGLTASYGSFSALQAAPVLNHSVLVSGLTPNTTYHYRVYSKDAAGNVAISADASFTTAAPAADTIAPSLSILAPSDGAAVTGVVVVSGTAADETGLLSVEVRVDAGAFTAASGLQNWTYNLDTSALSSGPHTITARATDTSANTRSASVGITVDRTAPVISNVAVTGITATGATVTWNTNEASNSQVEYSSASSGTLNVLDGTATVSHSMQLNDLSPGTLYTYRVRSRDAAGNLAVSSDGTFTTATATLPIEVGSQIAGSFSDATGHSAQGHLVYAENSRVWWLFTLTSTADSAGNRIIKSYFSSGPDLRTATWTAGPGSPTATANSSSQFMGSGRALSVAYLNNAGQDTIHAEIAMAFDGQDGTVGHIRGRLSAATMTWETWNNHVEGAATWTLPRNTALGVSSGKFIHSGGTILQQEVDANVRKSTNADTGAAWTSGFSAVAVIDNSMIHASNALAFAALDTNVMLAVYDNGGGPSCGFNCVPAGSPSEPNLNNLGYKRSNTNGSWTGVPVGGQGPGDGSVFGSNAIINQNDWAVVRLSSTTIYAFRKSANGSGLDGASYNVAGNNWSPLAPQPPLFASGQAFKGGAGVFGATDGVNIWLFVINTDAANSILVTQFNGAGGFWTPWATVPGTDAGAHTRAYIAGDPQPRNNRIALLWTEGSNPYREMVAAFDTGPAGPDTTAPSVAITAPAANATVSGQVNVAGTASDSGGLDRVEIKIDAGVFAPATGLSNWTYALSTQSLPDGPHTITVRATDLAGNQQSASIGVVVDNSAPPQDTTPPSVSISTPTPGATVTGTVSVTGTASDNVALSLVEVQVDAAAYSAASGLASWSFSLNTSTLSNGSHTIRARATDSSGLTTVASIAVTVSNGVVNVFNNPGFESGTTQWVFPGQGSIDATIRHSGVNSAKMVRTTVGEAMIQNSPRVTVQPNTSYTAEVWIKTSGVAGGNGVRVLLLWLDSTGAAVTTTVLVTGLVGTADWQKISRSAMVTPANAVSGRLQLFLSGASGTVWFDDVLLFK